MLESELAEYVCVLKSDSTIKVRISNFSRQYRDLSREELEQIVERIRVEIERRKPTIC